MSTKWLFSERWFIFYRGMSIARQNICYLQIFPLDKFFDKHFLRLLKSTRSTNKWIGRQITEERAKTHKKDNQILSLHIFSAFFFKSRPSSILFILVWESVNPLVSSKTDSWEQNFFFKHCLNIIVHISQNWMLGIKFKIKK